MGEVKFNLILNDKGYPKACNAILRKPQSEVVENRVPQRIDARDFFEERARQQKVREAKQTAAVDASTGQQSQSKKHDKSGSSAQSCSKIENYPANLNILAVARVKADINAQLKSTRKEDVASRKTTFKNLCVRWHPDKNTDDTELATQVFQYIQSQRHWYLKE